MKKKFIKSLALATLISSTLLCQTTFAMDNKTNFQSNINVKASQGDEYQELKSLPGFKNLSADKQKFLKETLYDKEKMTSILNQFFNAKKSLKINENIEIVRETKIENLSTSKGRQKRDAVTSTRVNEHYTLKMAGLNILSTRAYINYDYVPGMRIERINSYDIYTVVNWPAGIMEVTGKTAYISAGKTMAIAEAKINIKVGIKLPYIDQISYTMDDFIFTIRGDENGNSTQSWEEV